MEQSVPFESNERSNYGMPGVQRSFDDGTDPSEGTLTKQIERVTTSIPSATFLSLALGAMGVSAALNVFGHRKQANFVGQWVPTILIMGLYNKLVKLHGSEGTPG